VAEEVSEIPCAPRAPAYHRPPRFARSNAGSTAGSNAGSNARAGAGAGAASASLGVEASAFAALHEAADGI
jgi:hypothetical protein